MSIQFFGHFLVEQGDIDELQLDRAIELTGAENLPIGQTAVQLGYLSQADGELIHQHQRWKDLAFGELAIQLGLLQPQGLLELLSQQKTRHVQLGETLVEMTALTRLRLDHLLTLFETDQTRALGSNNQLPKELAQEALFIEATEVLPTLSRRVARVWVRLGEATPWRGTTEHPVRVSMEVSAPHTLGFGLAFSPELANSIATGMLGCAAAADDLEDALGEYLNLIIGHGKVRLGHASDSTQLGIPEFRELPETGWVMELHARCGKGVLILQPAE